MESKAESTPCASPSCCHESSIVKRDMPLTRMEKDAPTYSNTESMPALSLTRPTLFGPVPFV